MREVSGIVDLIWLAMETPCINITTVEGKVQVLPALGDTWRHA
jgi:hypothetical protein